MDTDVGRHLGKWFRDHPIYSPLEQLHDATYSVSVAYGRQGPDTSWNKPFRTSGSAFSGSTHSNASRPTTPVHNTGLHPNWNTPPPSRPSSWQSLSQMKKLEEENHTLKEKLDSTKEELRQAREESKSLASANKRILELESQKNLDEATIERVRFRSAKAYVRFKQYQSAASEYEQLSLLKKDERKLRAALKDEDGKRKAEDDEIFYMFEQAKALAGDEQFGRAEKGFQSVLCVKQKLEPARATAVDARDVQTRLCECLTRQGKSSEAKELFLDAAAPLRLGSLDRRVPEDCTWALQNAISYTHLSTKDGDYGEAMYWFKRIWPYRHKATSQGLQNLETRTLDIVAILESRGELKHQIKLLEKVCSDNSGPVSERVLYCYAKLGMLYHNRGRPDNELPADDNRHDHGKATVCLAQAWIERRRLDIIALRSTGWTLALSLVHLKRYENARDVLLDLQQAVADVISDDQPSNDQILGLLAHTYLMLENLPTAEANAADLFKHYGVTDIFANLRSASIDFSTFHHADTLLRALTRQTKKKDRFKEARVIWVAIFKAREDIFGSDGSGKAQLSRHIAIAKVFADAWEVSDKKLKRTPAGSKEVRDQIKKVEALTKQ